MIFHFLFSLLFSLAPSHPSSLYDQLRSLVLSGQTQNIQPLLDQHERTDLSAYPLLLLDAIDSQNADTVDFLINKGIPYNSPLSMGQTPLEIASQKGCQDIVARLTLRQELHHQLFQLVSSGSLSKLKQFLLEHKDRIHIKSDPSLIFVAIKRGDLNIFNQIFWIDVNLIDVIDPTQNYTPLHFASEIGQFNITNRLCVKKELLNLVDSQGCTPLHLAAQKGHKDIVELLISKGAFPSFPNFNKQTPLHLAAQAGHNSVVEFLISQSTPRIPLDSLDLFKNTPLHLAASEGHTSTIHLLISKGASAYLLNDFSYSPLHLAIQNQHLSVVSYLLSQDLCLFDTATSDVSSKNVLQMALEVNHTSIIDTLLKYIPPKKKPSFKKFFKHKSKGRPWNEILLDTPNEAGDTPLHLAVCNGNTDIVRQLTLKGTHILSKNSIDYTPVHLASYHGFLDILQHLVSFGAPLHDLTILDETPLYLASSNGHSAVVEYLFGKVPSTAKCLDKNQRSPLYIASFKGYHEIVDVLLQDTSLFNLSFFKDLSPLIVAVQGHHVEVVRSLLSKQVPMIYETFNNNTLYNPLHIACRLGYHDIVLLLIKQALTLQKTLSFSPPSRLPQNNPVRYLTNSDHLIIRSTDSEGHCPLYISARYGHDQIVDTLLKNQAFFSQKKDSSPLMIAVQFNHVGVVRTLLSHKVPVVSTSDDRTTTYNPLYLACWHQYQPIIESLLEYDPQLTEVFHDHLPLPISHLVCQGALEILRLLFFVNPSLIHSSSPDLPTHPFLTAIQQHQTSIVQLFLETDSQLSSIFSSHGYTPLGLATSLNLTDIIELLISFKHPIDAVDRHDRTPLYIACYYGFQEALKILLDHKASVTFLHPQTHASPLLIACQQRHPHILPLLLPDASSLVNYQDKKGLSPLFLATLYQLHSAVELLLTHKADPNIQNKEGLTPLHITSQNGYLSQTRLLLQYGASPDIQTFNGYTPLHLSVLYELTDITQLLIQHNAQIDPVDAQGMTPLYLAVYYNLRESLKVLLDHGASAHFIHSKTGSSLLLVACEQHHFDLLPLLIPHSTSLVNQPNLEGSYPLFYVTQNRLSSFVQLLLSYGADPHIFNQNGETPLHIASQNGDFQTVSILLQYKMSPNVKNLHKGYTSLHLSVLYGSIHVTELLLQYRADAFIADSDSVTPFDLAQYHHNSKFLSLFKKYLFSEYDTSFSDDPPQDLSFPLLRSVLHTVKTSITSSGSLAPLRNSFFLPDDLPTFLKKRLDPSSPVAQFAKCHHLSFDIQTSDLILSHYGQEVLAKHELLDSTENSPNKVLITISSFIYDIATFTCIENKLDDLVDFVLINELIQAFYRHSFLKNKELLLKLEAFSLIVNFLIFESIVSEKRSSPQNIFDLMTSLIQSEQSYFYKFKDPHTPSSCSKYPVHQFEKEYLKQTFDLAQKIRPSIASSQTCPQWEDIQKSIEQCHLQNRFTQINQNSFKILSSK